MLIKGGSGKCAYCGEETSERKEFIEGLDDVGIKPSWVFYHIACRGLQLLSMEDAIQNDLKKKPLDKALRAAYAGISQAVDMVVADYKNHKENGQ